MFCDGFILDVELLVKLQRLSVFGAVSLGRRAMHMEVDFRLSTPGSPDGPDAPFLLRAVQVLVDRAGAMLQLSVKTTTDPNGLRG